MQINYTHQWTSSFPTSEQRLLAMEEWGEELAGLSGDAIANGFRKLPLDFPPSPKKFRSLCVGYDEHNTPAYRLFDKSKAIELKPDKELARIEKEKIMQLLNK